MPRRRPVLSPEEEALWREVIRSAVPLAAERRAPAESGSPAEPDRKPRRAEPVPPSPRRPRPAGPVESPATRVKSPPVSVDLAEPIVAPVGRPVPGLDRRTAERLRRGAREPDARIDLHGMTAERAHRALDRCIGQALARGQRLVLVITGKGGRPAGPDAPFMGAGTGRLRREAPRWLTTGPHARHILDVFEAHPRHGGSGAFYVYLRRQR